MSANRLKPSKETMVPLGLSLLCFFYYLAFLLHFGEMFYVGSDIVANTAYGVTMFSEVHRAGWTVPKPAHMLLFGFVYWITRDLLSVHVVLITATALTVWAGCRLIQRRDAGLIGCIAFCLFMMVVPFAFGTTLSGGPGCVNVMFLFLSIVCVERIDRKSCKILAALFLSLANLTRPDSWPSTYLIISLVIALRFIRPKGPRLNRTDLVFLIPLGMPLVWVLVDWTVFGDPLYSVKIAQTYVVEAVKGKSLPGEPERDVVAAYFPKVKTALFTLFSISAGLSARAAVVGILCLAGIVAMFRTEPRRLLLVACPVLGTLLFYFVYALRGTLFRLDYVYTVLVCALLIAGVGLGMLCDLARRVRPALVGRFIQVGLACLVLAFLTVEPFQKKVVAERLPQLKNRAAVAVGANAAIESLVEDVRRSGGRPIILAMRWIPPSRIAMRLGTGQDLFLVERLVSRERLGKESVLPPLEGRTVYLCFLNSTRRDVALYLRRIIERADRSELIHDQGGLAVLKCTY